MKDFKELVEQRMRDVFASMAENDEKDDFSALMDAQSKAREALDVANQAVEHHFRKFAVSSAEFRVLEALAHDLGFEWKSVGGLAPKDSKDSKDV